jgi:hypothetical protein
LRKTHAIDVFVPDHPASQLWPSLAFVSLHFPRELEQSDSFKEISDNKEARHCVPVRAYLNVWEEDVQRKS